MKKLPNKLGHFNFLAFLIRSWNFDLEHGGGAIFSQWSGGVKRGGRLFLVCFRTWATSLGYVGGKHMCEASVDSETPVKKLRHQIQICSLITWGWKLRRTDRSQDVLALQWPRPQCSGWRGSGLGKLLLHKKVHGVYAGEDILKLMAGCHMCAWRCVMWTCQSYHSIPLNDTQGLHLPPRKTTAFGSMFRNVYSVVILVLIE